MKHFDVIVVGGGHAGAEAAWFAARMGAKVALVTLSKDSIGVMSCNPAIGGLGKGHLVREIDAMGGLMGLAADAAGIQFRLLNRTKGPAVRGPRAQSDRVLYRDAIQSALACEDGLSVIASEVTDLQLDAGRVAGVILKDGASLSAGAVILTTGTFLRGVIHIGDRSHSGGRMGENAADALSRRLIDLDLPLGRLKTGTPPRLDGRTINWDCLEMQPGDTVPEMFSFMSTGPSAKQVSCGITHTNEKTHDLIRQNLARSAMYGGHIDGIGPRYCPSIEDKVVRFADKTSHQVFLEPEGLTTDTIYPNGISTSLPADVQEDYVRSIAGLENVKIQQLGYAIEYDYIDPRALTADLQLSRLPGLFLAGQINGTTGYEEAAAQGLVAGINAVQLVRGKEPLRLGRSSSYIGVMVDDLTTRGVSEPYRMFTSRAEFRLLLRADNADQRLTEIGRNFGTVHDDRWVAFEKKVNAIRSLKDDLSNMELSAREIAQQGIKLNPDSPKRTALDAMTLSDFEFSTLRALRPDAPVASKAVEDQVKNDALYAHYVERQKRDVADLQKEEDLMLPSDLNFKNIDGLSNELAQKLTLQRPQNIAQARRVDGMTPAALIVLISHLKRNASKKAV